MTPDPTASPSPGAIAIAKRRSERQAAGLCARCASPCDMNPVTNQPFRLCRIHRDADTNRRTRRGAGLEKGAYPLFWDEPSDRSYAGRVYVLSWDDVPAREPPGLVGWTDEGQPLFRNRHARDRFCAR